MIDQNWIVILVYVGVPVTLAIVGGIYDVACQTYNERKNERYKALIAEVKKDIRDRLSPEELKEQEELEEKWRLRTKEKLEAKRKNYYLKAGYSEEEYAELLKMWEKDPRTYYNQPAPGFLKIKTFLETGIIV